MFHNILVPVDLTDKNVAAVEVAKDIAFQSDGAVALLHVIETLDVPADELRGFYEGLAQKAEQKLKDFSSVLDTSGVTCEWHVVYGKRVSEVIAFANDKGHDLIVMKSHRLNTDRPGEGVFTISHQVAMAADMSVLIVK